MGWLHTAANRAIAERDRRIAWAIVRRLRKLGYANAKLFDKRDVYGARLWPVNATVGALELLCRPVGYVAGYTDRDYLESHPGAFLQLGAVDLRELIGRIERQ